MRRFILPLIVLIVFSCKNTGQTKATVESESFDVFNQRFHTDSLFQLSRVKFPIEGQQIDAFDERDWTPNNWIMLKVPVAENVDTTEYKHSLKKTAASVEEAYWVEESGFHVERQFKLIDGKWYLTYYNDVNI